MLNAKREYNCPNCGAPISSEKCPYCGTVFYDFTCINMAEPTYIKIRHHGEIIMCKAYLTSAEFKIEPIFSRVPMVGGNDLKVKIQETARISLEFDVLQENGILFTAIKEE